MNRMLKIFKSEIFISTYENMPWEPMCYLGIKDASPETKIIGCQHTVVSEFSTNYFLYDNELKNRQLPDKICTVGPVTKRIIERNCGYNHPPIESACALRYQHLKQEDVRFRRNKRKILVALEGIDDVYKLVNYVCNELSQNDNIEIIIRPHPILPLSKIDKNIDIDYTKLNYVKISSNDSITKDLEKVSVVIYRESAVALEAIAFGIPVVCFNSYPTISYDPLFELTDFKWNVDESIRIKPILDEIFNLDDQFFNQSKQKAKLYINNYFNKCTDDNMSVFTHA